MVFFLIDTDVNEVSVYASSESLTAGRRPGLGPSSSRPSDQRSSRQAVVPPAVTMAVWKVPGAADDLNSYYYS